MRKSLILGLIIAQTACNSQLRENASDFGEVAINPEVREIHYKREGDIKHYRRFECAGDFCQE